jgi:F0F1-type ATP synthase alpha subunit
MLSVDILKMDIFFVITTVFVLLLGVLGTIALFYIIKAIKTFSRILSLFEKEAESAIKDAQSIREYIKKKVYSTTDAIEKSTGFFRSFTEGVLKKGAGKIAESFLSRLEEKFSENKKDTSTKEERKKNTKRKSPESPSSKKKGVEKK